jgi:hypothetical protein
MQLKSSKQLLGRAGERFLLLGMLCRSKEGKLCIEDADGSVEIDITRVVRRYVLDFWFHPLILILALG